MEKLNTKMVCKVALVCLFFLLLVTFSSDAAEIDGGSTGLELSLALDR